MEETDPTFFETLFTTDNLIKILFLAAGLLMRDIYSFGKKKISKGPKPKIHIEYSARHTGSKGMKPRIFKFEAILTVENISNLYAYDLSIKFESERWRNIKSNQKPVGDSIELKSLEPNQKWVISSFEEVELMDYPEQKSTEGQIIPDYFKDLRISLIFKNEKNKTFTKKYSNSN